jgi:hypothetical protein
MCCSSSAWSNSRSICKGGEDHRTECGGFENPYSGRCGDYFEFFLERAEVLCDLVGRVNQAY